VPFNEGWGQFDTVRVTEWTKRYDPTRLVNPASGGNDFPVGDIKDLHAYPGPAAPKPDGKRAIVLGEFGGLGLPLEGHVWQSRDNWGYRTYHNVEDLTRHYRNLMVRLRPLIDDPGLTAAVYTQTTDVEGEVNGLLTYDRAVVKIPEADVLAAHKLLSEPPAQVRTIVPDARRQAVEWRYTTEKPADGWEKPDFDDSGWKTGPAGFGTEGTPGATVRTTWDTPEIWIRRSFEMPEQVATAGLHLTIHHDEDAEVYLNGVQATRVRRYTSEYEDQPISPAAAATLKAGKNTIAVHCKQTEGGQYIDVGLWRSCRAPRRRSSRARRVRLAAPSLSLWERAGVRARGAPEGRPRASTRRPTPRPLTPTLSRGEREKRRPSPDAPSSALRLRLPASQVVAQVGLERRHALGFPRGLDALGDLAVAVHQLAEHDVVARAGRGAAVGVVRVGAQQVAAAVGGAVDHQLHVRVMAVAEPQAVLRRVRGRRVAFEHGAGVEVGGGRERSDSSRARTAEGVLAGMLLGPAGPS
jgi:hypothetical protein